LVKWALVLAAALLLTACTDRVEQAQEMLKSRVAEKRYLEFQELQTFPDGVVCGEFRTTNPMHGNSRFSRFIVWGDTAEDRPSEVDWTIFCSKDPAAALFSTFGIGPAEDAETGIPQIRNDLNVLQTALAQYLDDNFSMPSTAQGLAALVAVTDVPPKPPKFKAGGYLAAVPDDPWGRPYLYERSRLAGVAQTFRIYTLGADGMPGGTGKDADVGTEHLKYLDHIAP
jgi:general secretion pathway protein G